MQVGKPIRIDDSNKEAFLEIQSKFNKFANDLAGVEATLGLNHSNMKRSIYTLDEIVSLPENTKTYRSVGKMFVLTERKEITDEIETFIGQCKGNLQNLAKKKAYLEKEIKGCEDAIRELAIE